MVPADFDAPVYRRRHAGSHRKPAWRRILAIITAGTALRYLQRTSPRARSGYPTHRVLTEFSSMNDD